MLKALKVSILISVLLLTSCQFEVRSSNTDYSGQDFYFDGRIEAHKPDNILVVVRLEGASYPFSTVRYKCSVSPELYEVPNGADANFHMKTCTRIK